MRWMLLVWICRGDLACVALVLEGCCFSWVLWQLEYSVPSALFSWFPVFFVPPLNLRFDLAPPSLIPTFFAQFSHTVLLSII